MNYTFSCFCNFPAVQDNVTVLWMDGYPSGYSLIAVVIICIIAVFMMAVIVIGNLLVIIAIFSEFSLQCVQNWFVASLAVADLTLGIFVMPFSLAQEIMGYWVFGDVWCQEQCLKLDCSFSHCK